MITRASSLHTVSTASTDHSPTIRSPSITNKLPAGTSLYLSCRSILEKLSLVPNMEYYIDFITDSQNNDPLNKLWNICRQGVSLVVLFNALDPEKPLTIDLSSSQLNECKKNVYRFIVACRNVLLFKDEDLFTLSDLYKDNTSGFIKVIHTIDIVLQVLEEKGVIVSPKLDGDTIASSEPRNTRDKVVLELLETERKYVLDLETLQNYMRQVQTQAILSPEAVHYLFGNLNILIDFQRRFLIQLEGTAQKPPEEQDFGSLFIQNESAFTVYEPYCANFFAAQDLVVQETPKLQKLAIILNPVYELPSMLIKPVQRICKYPLLMQQLIKSTHSEWAHVANMEQGLQAIRRVTEKVNETQRKHENIQILDEVKRRIDELRPAQIDSFGRLLLNDKIMMSQSDAPEKEMQVYLFEKTILMCKESRDSTKNKTSSISIKKKRRGSLEPKGVIVNSRIWNIRNRSSSGNYCLTIDWKDSDIDQVMFRFQNGEKMKLWESTLRSNITFKKINVSNTQLLSMKNVLPARIPDSFRTDNDIERNNGESVRPKSSVVQSKISNSARNNVTPPFHFLSGQDPHGFLNRSQSESIVPEQVLYPNRARSKSSPNIKQQLNQQPVWKSALSHLVESPSPYITAPSSLTEETLKLKLAFNNSIYVIVTRIDLCYAELIQKANRKIRTISALHSTDKLKFKYQDEDGDYITMSSDEDVQMALEMRGASNTITLFVSL